MLKVGIVGLPNVGKSTLFNALLKKQVANVANYPFCTIEPNIGVIEVPDERLPVLAKIVKTTKIIPAAVEFYDIAGLVAGASTGAGLGNQFLSHIREVDLIIHVVRLFEDKNIAHAGDKINPQQDIETINSELILADLQTLSKQKEPKGMPSKEEKLTYQAVVKLKKIMDQGVTARDANLSDDEKLLLKKFNLLTFKRMIYVFNVSEKQLNNYQDTLLRSDNIRTTEGQANSKIQTIVNLSHPEFISGSTLANAHFKMLKQVQHDNFIIISAKLESEVVALSPDEQTEYLKQYNLSESGLNRLIKIAYKELGLISFLTGGEKEVRAWTIKKGTLAPQAAGVIHTDFEKHFIKAEVVPYQTFIDLGGWIKCREAGKANICGKDYIIKDGDVIDFKVNI